MHLRGSWPLVVAVVAGVGAFVAAGVGVLTNLATAAGAPWWAWPLLIGFVVTSAGVAVFVAAAGARERREESIQRRNAVLPPIAGPSRTSGAEGILTLIGPEAGLTPFVGRTSEVRELVGWCTDPRSRPVHVIAGVSGVGKTRTVYEAVRCLPKGWAAGRLQRGHESEAVDIVKGCGDPTLIVVDDADLWPECVRVLDDVLRYDGHAALRAVFLVRDAEGFEQWLAQRWPAGRGAPPTNSSWDVMHMRVIGEIGDRRRWFAASLTAYRAVLAPGIAFIAPDCSRVGEPGEPMLVTCVRAALAALAGGSQADIDAVRVAGTSEIARQVLAHERGRWVRSARDSRWCITGPGLTDNILCEAVLALILAGSVTTSDASATLGRLRLMNGQPDAVVEAIAEWARSLYPRSGAGGALVAPVPEFLLGAIIASCADSVNRDVVGAVFSPSSDLALRTPTPLVRAASLFPAAAALVRALLAAHPALVVSVFESAAFSGLAAQGAVRGELLVALARATLVDADVQRLLDVVDLVGVAALRVAVHRIALDRVRAAVATSSEGSASLGRAMRRLGVALTDSEEHDEAAAVLRAAVQLARPQSDVGGAEVAGSLIDLSRCLSAMEEFDEAAATAEEAYVLEQAAAAAVDGPTLSRSRAMFAYGRPLGAIGRRAEGRSLMESAVTAFRRLGRAAEADLAESLLFLAVYKLVNGENDAALSLKRESVGLYDRLADVQPARFSASLVRALGPLAGSAARATEEDLAMMKRAIAIYRELAVSEPARYGFALATALRDLAVMHATVNEGREAEASLRSALELCRRIYEERSSARMDQVATLLGGCLHTLGRQVASSGRRTEALVLLKEAVDYLKPLAAAVPGMNEWLLGRALHDVGKELGSEGQLRDAIEYFQEAAHLWREIAANNLVMCVPDLAVVLKNLAHALRAVGNEQEALAIEIESMRWWMILAQAHPQFENESRAQQMRLGVLATSWP